MPSIAPSQKPIFERLNISDYRSCIKTTIDLQPDLSVIVGPNGSGKTNILRAFFLLRSLAARTAAESLGQEFTDECRLEAGLRLGRKRAVLTAQMQLRADDRNADVIVGAHESWYAKDFTRNAKRIRYPIWIAGSDFFRQHIGRDADAIAAHFGATSELPHSFRSTFATFAQFFLGIKYYSASQFTNPSLCPPSIEIGPPFGPRLQGGGHAKFLFDLFAAQRTQSYARFIDVVGPNGIHLFDDLKFQEMPTSSLEYTVRSGGRVQQRKREKVLVVPQFVIGRNELSPSQLSDGTFKTLTLLFYLMTDNSNVLLIEEPEVCVHHGLLASIVELIKDYSQQKQIIMSTHSDSVLDQIESRQLYRVSRSGDAGTSVSQIEKAMSGPELKSLRTYLETEGNLGEYWRNGGFDAGV